MLHLVSPTFIDVLTEVKHAFLDSVSLLSHLHVLVNLKVHSGNVNGEFI